MKLTYNQLEDFALVEDLARGTACLTGNADVDRYFHALARALLLLIDKHDGHVESVKEEISRIKHPEPLLSTRAQKMLEPKP